MGIESKANCWEICQFEDMLDYDQPTQFIVRNTNYCDQYSTPVLTAGKSFIKGYTNEEDGIFRKLPTIIFDDFTTATKFVNFPFKVKSSAMKILVPTSDLVDLKFVYYQMQINQVRTDTHKRFWISVYAKREFLLPPLNEQRRIVAKIEELFSELDKGVESLKKTRAQLKTYRQAVLKHAFEGKLTARWREENKDKLEPAEKLLERIKTERAARYQQQLEEWKQAVKKWRDSGKEDKKPAKPRTQKEPEPLSYEEIQGFPAVPRGWSWCSLDEIISGKPRSMQSGPFGSNLKHSEFQKEGVLVLGIDNVHAGRFSMGSQNRISKAKFEELKKYEARSGDLLVTVMASLGRTCVVPRDLEQAIITKHVYRITMEQELLFPEFYNLLLQSETVSRRRMFKSALGQTRPGLNGYILRSLPLPLCGMDEQKEIVKRLEFELSRIVDFEVLIEREIQRSKALRQSILKKAFSGQLVSQDSSDEPASVLLERIRTEKAAQQITKAKARKKTKRKAAA
jgi:type I restriction enzyme, S subunit